MWPITFGMGKLKEVSCDLLIYKQTRVLQYWSLRMTIRKVDWTSRHTVFADLEYLFEK